MSKVIAVMNQKGGVGKTTSTVNLGAALAQKSFKVLLVDLDPSGSLSNWLCEENAGDDPGLGELIFGLVSDDDVVKRSDILGLDFITAGRNLNDVSPKGGTSIYSLKEKIRALRDKYDFVLFDCPPSSDFLAGNALIASDSILIPIQTETLPLHSGIRFLDWLDTFINTQNSSVDILGILPCMFDSRTRLSHLILETMRTSENLGPLVFNTVIRKNVRLAEIAGSGRSIFKSASSSYGANDYTTLAEEVMQRTGINSSAFDSEESDSGDGEIDESKEIPAALDSGDGEMTDGEGNIVEEPIFQHHSFDTGMNDEFKNGEN